MINLVFLATPEIAVNSLRKLLSFNDINIMAVVTPIDKPAGRGKQLCCPPVKLCAQKNGVKVCQTKSIRKDVQLIKELKDMNPDFFITFAFGQILSQEVLDIPKIATINLHASLLPKYRGANPIQRVIVNGETKTGICTMITELGLDEGDICLQDEVNIDKNMTCIDLAHQISENAPFLLYRTIKGLYNGNLKPKKQNNEEATYANKFEKADGKIDWTLSAFEIHNKIRGLLLSPNAYFECKNKHIKIMSSEIFDENICEDCGKILSIEKNGIVISTKKGSVLIKTIKPEGKGEMPANSWINGVQLKAGDFVL